MYLVRLLPCKLDHISFMIHLVKIERDTMKLKYRPTTHQIIVLFQYIGAQKLPHLLIKAVLSTFGAVVQYFFRQTGTCGS